MRSGADRVRPFELFFDLVFVFSLIQITNSIVDDDDLLGIFHGLVVLGIVWWIWASFTSLANMGLPAGTRWDWRPPVFVLAMGLMLLVAISIPTAFWAKDQLFAFGVGALWLVWATAQLFCVRSMKHLRTNLYRFIVVGSLLPLTLIASTFLSDDNTGLILLGIGLISAVVTTTLPRSPDWPVGREHLSERYELFVIITLGESLISIGLGATGATRNLELILGILISVLLVAMMWRTYLVGVADPGRSRLLDLDYSGAIRLIRIGYVFLHLALVAAIICVAAGLKVAMNDVNTPVSPLFGGVLILGLITFLVTVMVFRGILTASYEWWRLIPLAGLLAVWLLAGRSPDLVFLGSATLVAIIGSLPDLRRRESVDAGYR